jgi:hypothetical protein
MLETLLFWGGVSLTVAKVMGDSERGGLRRELLAVVLGFEVAVVLALALA